MPKVSFFHTKCLAKMGRVSSQDGRVRDDKFMVGSWSDYARIMVGLCSDHSRIDFLLAEAINGFFD